MPQSFTPNLIPRWDQGLLRYINENFSALSRILNRSPVESVSGTAPTSPYVGQGWFDTTVNRQRWWNGTEWIPFVPWKTFATVFTQGATLTQSGSTVSEYTIDDSGEVKWEGAIYPTTNGTVGSDLQLTLPATARNALSHPGGGGWYYDSSAGANYPFIVYFPTTTTCKFLSTINGNIIGPVGAGSFPAGQAAANGDALVFYIRYQLA